MPGCLNLFSCDSISSQGPSPERAGSDQSHELNRDTKRPLAPDGRGGSNSTKEGHMKIADATRKDGTGIRVHYKEGRFLIELYTARRSGLGLEIASLEFDEWDFACLGRLVKDGHENYLKQIEDALTASI